MSASDDAARRKAMGHDCVMLAGDSGGPILKQGTTSVVAIGSGYLAGNGRLKCAMGNTQTAERFASACSNMAVGISSTMADRIAATGAAVRIQRYLLALGYQAGETGDISGETFKSAVAAFRRDYKVPKSFDNCNLETIIRMRLVST